MENAGIDTADAEAAVPAAAEAAAGAGPAAGAPRKSQFPEDRKLDLESLKALAHPLRVQILDTLSTYGQFTASGLAERLGESSGATSYHLRQLERHGFVREVEGKGTGRERWWERVPGGITLSSQELATSGAGRAASKTLLRQWERTRGALLTDFMEHGYDVLAPEWTEISTVSTVNLRLTAEQLKHVVEEWEDFTNRVLDEYRGKNPPGSRPVQVHFNAFPVLDGTPTPPVSTADKEATTP
ncbi:MAG: transcriptional regulator [Rhodoglobus sp.]|nr:transcriptional regulator [Rhodoglobus sp.]